MPPVIIRSELQAALARGIGERLDAPVVEIAAAVEHDVLDALLDRALGDQLADRLGGVDIGAGLGSRMSFSSDEAAATVTPFTSSITWA